MDNYYLGLVSQLATHLLVYRYVIVTELRLLKIQNKSTNTLPFEKN